MGWFLDWWVLDWRVLDWATEVAIKALDELDVLTIQQAK